MKGLRPPPLSAVHVLEHGIVGTIESESDNDNVTKNCHSYVGKVTQKQQIWISSDCSPADIAHEIMHALGFVHEQNRSDRDDFINVTYENIEDEFRYNFAKLPDAYMTVTGRAPFDFQSLML